MQQPQTLPVHPAFTNRKILVLAVLLGVIAAGLVVAFVSQSRGSSKSTPVATVAALVATQDIAAGTKITDKMVAVKQVPQDAVIANPLADTKTAVGQVARFPIAQGQQLSSTAIGQSVKSTALSYEIPPGKRAVTIPVGQDLSPAPLMVPGDFVDVLAVGELDTVIQGAPGATPVATTNGQTPPKVVVTLVQNVQVLAIQSTYVDAGVPYNADTRGAQATDKSITNVTLALDPAQAQLVFLASQGGTNSQQASLTVVLRHVGDEDTPAIPPVAEPIQLPTVTH